MTLNLRLTPEQVARLEAAAEREGLATEDFALKRLLGESPVSRPPGSLADLFAQWRKEDATDDQGELARRDADLEKLKANLNANRAAAGEKPLFR
jgi:hypothetical protein